MMVVVEVLVEPVEDSGVALLEAALLIARGEAAPPRFTEAAEALESLEPRLCTPELALEYLERQSEILHRERRRGLRGAPLRHDSTASPANLLRRPPRRRERAGQGRARAGFCGPQLLHDPPGGFWIATKLVARTPRSRPGLEAARSARLYARAGRRGRWR